MKSSISCASSSINNGLVANQTGHSNSNVFIVLKSNDPFTNQLHSRRADKSVFPPGAPVSNVANSRFQNVPGHRRERPRLSIQLFCKARPARRDVLADPHPHAERGSVTGAGKHGDPAGERSRSILPPSSFCETHTGT